MTHAAARSYSGPPLQQPCIQRPVMSAAQREAMARSVIIYRESTDCLQGKHERGETMLEVRLTLPDNLAREAQAEGLLTPETLERLLREEVRRRRVDELFEAADRLAALNTLPLTDAEIEAEIQAARAERRANDARRH